MLLAEAMIEQGYEEVLAHLSGAELTPAEAALGPLVREMVWYRTTSLKRHARRVRPRFSPPALPLDCLAGASLL